MDLTRHPSCFCCGQASDGRMDPDLTWDETTQRLRGHVHFGPHTEGPPGHVHGGSIATVLDECMGASAWMSGHPALAASLTIQYRKMVRLGSRLAVEAGVETIDGRKVSTAGRLVAADGSVMAEGTGLFIMVPEATLRRSHPRYSGLQNPAQRLELWITQGRS